MGDPQKAFNAGLSKFRASRRLPVTTEDDYVDDVADYIAWYRGSRRGGGNRSKDNEGGWLELELPGDLTERERTWVAARLARSVLAESVRRELGYDGVPFPNDAEAADALAAWAIEHHKPPEPSMTLRLPRPRMSEPPVPGALRNLQPTLMFRTGTGQMEPESREVMLRRAARRLVEEAEHLSTRIGCELNEALRWILCGEQPKHACLNASAHSRLGGPNTVTLEINADVVTPEEVRTVYRRMRRVASPVDDEVSAFLTPIAGNTAMSWEKRLVHWNETHPLRRFKNIASFKTAAWRAKRKHEAAVERARGGSRDFAVMAAWTLADPMARVKEPKGAKGRRRRS